MLKTFFLTDVGKKRKVNQDCVFTSENPVGALPNLFIVADGMGGHNAGDYASRLTIETIIKSCAVSDQRDPVIVIKKAVEDANRLVYETACSHKEYSGMGTTVVLCSIQGKTLTVANVGDSRLYVLNGDYLRQVTRDHSFVEEMVRNGTLKPGDAKNHPDKNIITRAVGVDEKVDVDFFRMELMEGDNVIMCSDGLTNMIEDEDMKVIIHKSRDIVEKTTLLVKAANDNGGKDNISVIVIEPGV